MAGFFVGLAIGSVVLIIIMVWIEERRRAKLTDEELSREWEEMQW
jgi:hypothetical protein